MSEEDRWLNAYCRWEDRRKEWHVAGREKPPTAPAVIPCCQCLQFNQICNSQYLGVA